MTKIEPKLNSESTKILALFGSKEVEYFTYIKCGGVLASTWVQKQKEHTGAHVDLDKNVQFTVANNDYQLAA